MLRFNNFNTYHPHFHVDFNTSYVTVQRFGRSQNMKMYCDFNTSYVTVQPCRGFQFQVGKILFQYILCYGSTMNGIINYTEHSEISIHPMLRFNVPFPIFGSIFYLISIHPMLRFNLFGYTSNPILLHFNTSYVTVQQLSFLLADTNFYYFNTSYVTVQHYFLGLFLH